MKTEVQVTFRGMEPSQAVEDHIIEKVAWLEKYHRDLISCRVVVELPHKHHHKGQIFHISLDITTPQGEVVVSHEQHDKHAHEDVYVALRDAFKAARRRLEDHRESPLHNRRAG